MGKRQLLICFLAFSILSTNTLVFGQEEKFGKIDESVLKMTRYEKDTNASALVLFDVGRTYLRYVQDKGFVIIHERHKRIKIFNKDGYEHANIDIAYFTPDKSTNSESIRSIKGTTYKLENGKVIKYNLENSSIFEEKLNSYISYKKFTLPNISEGVVIEYEYEIASDFIGNFRGWDFQESIPCLWSEYVSEIPEYFNFRTHLQGYLPLDVFETSNKLTQINLNFKYNNNSSYSSGNSNTVFSNELITLNTSVAIYVMKNVPAFKNESYITTANDYISSIEFQLISYQFPGEAETRIATSWENVAQRLMEFEDFGGQLKKIDFAKELINKIGAFTQVEDKIFAIYYFVKDNIKWNGEIGIYSNSGISKAFESKSGNVADINLLLTAMLKGASFEAYPVVLSTRNNGRNLFFASSSKFNYLVTLLKLEGKYILLDASRPPLPFGTLPIECLNDRGLVVKENGIEWIGLQGNSKAIRSSSIALDMSDEGKITGEIHIVDKEYAALINRNSIYKLSEEKFVEENWKKNNTLFDIQSYTFENLQQKGSPLKTTLKIDIDGESTGDRIYFNPVLVKSFEQNPFKLEERSYPVDFDYPIIENYFITLSIPKGYEVEELPKSISYTLLDNSGKYTYIVGKKDNTLQLRISLNINKFTFLPEEYKSLKEFFTQFIAKQSEQIVLKKIK